MTTQSLDREVEGRLREVDARYTQARRSVVSALGRADGPRSAAELRNALTDQIPLSSLYRSLSVLEEAGVVVPHHGARGLTRYELAEWLAGHHHHLVCVDCGVVDDVDIPPSYEAELERLVDRIGAHASFVTTGHVLEIEGRCARCA